ncbi:hypothetical protein EA462_03530 [Natrarchaeobius halalkaliphilus]|uniref:Uncharacterized protein n=1 Tax=Natrarchaeobius halalkaliphilus TaxID=1679091 RepID=A0A3N6P5X5_9EURY|nr:hypothetical protein [Natrarchaeobius halalkaliphilus]RQG91085.1 hypothetical protein EA462_03530 [Natrarchaeobius halalkaliphilus]
MDSRNKLTSVPSLGSLRKRVRTTLSGSRPRTNRSTDADLECDSDGKSPSGSPDSPGNLFHCSTCRTVYIAHDKRVCSECDEDLEQVSSTLSCR